MDRAALIKHFPKEDKIILKAYEGSVSQSHASKQLAEVLDRIVHER